MLKIYSISCLVTIHGRFLGTANRAVFLHCLTVIYMMFFALWG